MSVMDRGYGDRELSIKTQPTRLIKFFCGDCPNININPDSFTGTYTISPGPKFYLPYTFTICYSAILKLCQ